MDYLNELNDRQRTAVMTTEGHVLVVAGPGSGKTRVLTYRIAYLLEQGTPPYSILALTFTNKSAREMKERIAKVVGEKGNKVWAGTFHSIFARIMRVEAEKIGYPSNFTVYDSDDAKNVVKEVINRLNLDLNTYKPGAVLSRISSAKSNLITPPAYQDNEDLRKEDRINNRPHLAEIYKQYVAQCQKAGAMDFDDLLYRMFYLLQKNPDGVLEKYRQKFKYVMVDEFQDTNYLQYAIIRKLVNYPESPRNICVVGDDAQSIYAFRGATIQNILDFEKEYNNLQTIKLEQNYRSTEHIVQAANQLITFNRQQIPKQIRSMKGEGHPIKVLEAATDSDEAKRIADLVLEQKTRFHLHNHEIAILYRTNAQSRIFEEHLRRQNITYRVYGGLSFYQRKEVKDLLAYLRFVINPADDEALRRIINYPKRSIGKTTLDKIGEEAAAANTSLWEALKIHQATKRTAEAIKAFIFLIEAFQQRADRYDAHQLAEYVVRQSGLLAVLKADTTIEGIGRLDNTVALLDSIKEFVENDELLDDATLPDKKLGTYLQTISLHTEADSENANKDTVTLMSVHASKGLEFKSVFVTGLEENLFPSGMAGETPEGMDEERRLFYVAITRAEQFLTLSYAKSRYKFDKLQFGEPSRFLAEISPANLEPINPLNAPQRAKVTGISPNLRPAAQQPSYVAEPVPAYKPSPTGAVKQGCRVVHQRFGVGKVVKIEGGSDNQIATIVFDAAGEKRIMLRHAKLGVID